MEAGVARLGALAVLLVLGVVLASTGLLPENGQDRALIGATLVAFVMLALGNRRERRP